MAIECAGVSLKAWAVMTGYFRHCARNLVAVVAGLLGLTLGAQAQQSENTCSLASVMRMPLDVSGAWFTTTAAINGHPVVMLIDTGAAHSAISPELAKQLRLPEDRHTKIVIHGVGGDMKAAHPVIAHSFRAGHGDLVDYEMVVANVGGAGRKGQPGVPQGVIGIDLLSYYELEFDFPGRTLTLYESSNCSGNFAPWTGHFDTIKGKRQLDGQLFIPVRLNKEAINAVVDTGSSYTTLGIDTAHDIGISDAELRSDHPDGAFGASGVLVPGHRHYFDSFEVGETVFHRAPLSIQDEHFGVMQMLLGMDFLRPRKVWLSFKTEQVFLQYAAEPHEQRPPP
jgi:predicted aspartyl protease